MVALQTMRANLISPASTIHFDNKISTATHWQTNATPYREAWSTLDGS